jgi:hypothetical protein
MNIYWYVIYMASCPDKCRDIIGTTAISHTIWRAIVAESNHLSPHPHILLSCVLRSSPHPLYDTVSLQRLLSLAWLSIELSLIFVWGFVSSSRVHRMKEADVLRTSINKYKRTVQLLRHPYKVYTLFQAAHACEYSAIEPDQVETNIPEDSRTVNNRSHRNNPNSYK